MTNKLLLGMAVSLLLLSIAHFVQVVRSGESRKQIIENIGLLIELNKLQSERIDMLEQTK